MHREFEKAKRKLDDKLASDKKKVQEKYNDGLKVIRTAKAKGAREAERTLENRTANLEADRDAKMAKIDKAINEKIRENTEAQEAIKATVK